MISPMVSRAIAAIYAIDHNCRHDGDDYIAIDALDDIYHLSPIVSIASIDTGVDSIDSSDIFLSFRGKNRDPPGKTRVKATLPRGKC